MGRKIIPILVIPALIIATSCTSAILSKNQRSFKFFSGGSYHPSGYGEWRIGLEADGRLSIIHDVQGKTTEYGPNQISETENLQLWNLIDQCNFEKLNSSQRPGLPDEITYIFILKSPTGDIQVEMLIGDVQENQDLIVLVDQIGVIVETYTSEKPVLR